MYPFVNMHLKKKIKNETKKICIFPLVHDVVAFFYSLEGKYFSDQKKQSGDL